MADVLAALGAAHPGFAERLFDDTGELRRFVNVFVADEDIRFLDGLDTPSPRADRQHRPRRRRRLSEGRGHAPRRRSCGAAEPLASERTPTRRVSRLAVSERISRDHPHQVREVAGDDLLAGGGLHDDAVRIVAHHLRSDPGTRLAPAISLSAASSSSTFSLIRRP